MEPHKTVYSAPALEKAFDVFELLADVSDGLTISEMAARLDRTINELFRLIVVMERRRYLHKNPDTDRYTVAYKMLDIAYRATPAQDLTHAAGPVMFALAHAAAQSCHLVVPAEGHGLVIARQENPGPANFGVRLGAAVDLLRSCSGNLLLAFIEDDRLPAILPAGDDVDVLRNAPLAATLAAIRARGHERRPSPMTYGVIDISFPVFGFDGRIAAALTIPFLERIDGALPVSVDTAQALAGRAARQISAALGWHEDAARPL